MPPIRRLESSYPIWRRPPESSYAHRHRLFETPRAFWREHLRRMCSSRSLGECPVASLKASVSLASGDVPPSVITRSASLRAASTKIGSLSRVSAWSGVFVVERRTMQTSRSGASKTFRVGCGTVRFQKCVKTAAIKSVARAFHIFSAWIICRHHNSLVEIGRLIRINAWAAYRLLEQAGNLQSLIANHLGGKSKTRSAREQPVFRIARHEFGRGVGTLPVSGTQYHHLHQGLHVPTRIDKVARQPVEQFGMTGPLALQVQSCRWSSPSPAQTAAARSDSRPRAR